MWRGTWSLRLQWILSIFVDFHSTSQNWQRQICGKIHLVFDRLPSVLATLVPFVSVLDNLATFGVGRATLGKKLCVTLGTKYVSLGFRQRFTCRATQTRRMIGDQKQHLRNVMINIALVIIWWWSFTSKDSRQLSSGTSWNSSQGRW